MFEITLDEAIKNHVNNILENKERPKLPEDLIQTDSLGEVVEKLVILHIRMWMLEDAMAEAQTDEELADLKRKVDICFKQKRPMFVAAINRMVNTSILNNKSLVEESVKLYQGHQKNPDLMG